MTTEIDNPQARGSVPRVLHLAATGFLVAIMINCTRTDPKLTPGVPDARPSRTLRVEIDSSWEGTWLRIGLLPLSALRSDYRLLPDLYANPGILFPKIEQLPDRSRVGQIDGKLLPSGEYFVEVDPIGIVALVRLGDDHLWSHGTIRLHAPHEVVVDLSSDDPSVRCVSIDWRLTIGHEEEPIAFEIKYQDFEDQKLVIAFPRGRVRILCEDSRGRRVTNAYHVDGTLSIIRPLSDR